MNLREGQRLLAYYQSKQYLYGFKPSLAGNEVDFDYLREVWAFYALGPFVLGPWAVPQIFRTAQFAGNVLDSVNLHNTLGIARIHNVFVSARTYPSFSVVNAYLALTMQPVHTLIEGLVVPQQRGNQFHYTEWERSDRPLCSPYTWGNSEVPFFDVYSQKTDFAYFVANVEPPRRPLRKPMILMNQ